jgi:hypothetical protein
MRENNSGRLNSRWGSSLSGAKGRWPPQSVINALVASVEMAGEHDMPVEDRGARPMWKASGEENRQSGRVRGDSERARADTG